jgi:hypothetical protein
MPDVIWTDSTTATPVADLRALAASSRAATGPSKPYLLPVSFLLPRRTVMIEVDDVLAFQQELSRTVHPEGLLGISHVGFAVRYLRSGRRWRTWEQYVSEAMSIPVGPVTPPPSR